MSLNDDTVFLYLSKSIIKLIFLAEFSSDTLIKTFLNKNIYFTKYKHICFQ